MKDYALSESAGGERAGRWRDCFVRGGDEDPARLRREFHERHRPDGRTNEDGRALGPRPGPTGDGDDRLPGHEQQAPERPRDRAGTNDPNCARVVVDRMVFVSHQEFLP